MSCTEQSIAQYLRNAASDSPTPGGGSVSALAGALATSMSEMAGNFTTDKEKYAGAQEELVPCLKKLELARQKLLALADADMEAYSSVDEAYGLPQETDEQKTKRKEALQSALKEAMSTPLNIMRQCAAVAETSRKLVDIANPNLLTDIGVSAALIRGACEAARFNVEVNLKFIDDDQLVEDTRPEVKELSKKTAEATETVQEKVDEHLRS